MIDRNLKMSLEGAKVSDGKIHAYVNMLRRYPVDATTAVTTKLRPDGWFPPVDVMEAEIIEVLGWRLDLLDAFKMGRVISPEEAHTARTRVLAITMADTLRPLPLWDTGTERCAQERQSGLITLRAAVKSFCNHVGDKPHDYERELKRAEDWLAMDFLPRPKKETAEDRMEARRQQQRDIDSAHADFETTIDDDLIDKYAGEWLARKGVV